MECNDQVEEGGNGWERKRASDGNAVLQAAGWHWMLDKGPEGWMGPRWEGARGARWAGWRRAAGRTVNCPCGGPVLPPSGGWLAGFWSVPPPAYESPKYEVHDLIAALRSISTEHPSCALQSAEAACNGCTGACLGRGLAVARSGARNDVPEGPAQHQGRKWVALAATAATSDSARDD